MTRGCRIDEREFRYEDEMRPSWPQKSRGGCRCGFLLSSPLPERERASDDSNITQLGGKTFNLQKAQKGEPHAISVGCWPRPALVIGGAAPPCHRALVISTAASRDGGANTAAEVNLCAEPRCCLLLPCPGLQASPDSASTTVRGCPTEQRKE